MGKVRTSTIVFFLVLAGIVGGIGYWIYDGSKPGKYDEFAACTKDKGAVFYGAFWCPHCQDQKKIFGKSASKLNYVECSTPDGKGQTKICSEQDIQSYPTWKFNGEATKSGEISLQELADKTGCAIQ